MGYSVLFPVFVMRSLVDQGKKEGEEIELEIYYHVAERQPRPVLVGFNNDFERRFFQKLLTVEDIGPLKATRALTFSVSTIAQAIEERDAGLLQRMPGIGARTAQKIIATLHEKVAEFALLRDEGYTSMPPVAKADVREEAIGVLVGLGYRKAEATARVDEAIKRNLGAKDAEELIRGVFKEVFKKERE